MTPRRRKSVRSQVPAEYPDVKRGIRIQKLLAESGVASRRTCEKMITDGRVKVNGKIVNTLPAWVDPEHDCVEVDGQNLPRTVGRRRPEKKVYVLLHKPRHVITTSHDPHDRRTVFDLVDLPPSVAKRLFAVGRLDAESTGLILLTNDGPLANRLTHPRYEVPKQYQVSVRGRLSENDIRQLRSGLYLSLKSGSGAKQVRAKRTGMAGVKLVGHERDRTRGDRTTLLVTLREGRNREIRRLIAQLGHKVRRLERVAIGPLKLRGLAVGQWRRLNRREISTLLKSAGMESTTSPPTKIDL